MAYGFEIVKEQWDILASRMNAIRAGVNIIGGRLGPVDKDKSLHQAITDLSDNIAKWQSTQNDSIIAGFKLVAEAIAKLEEHKPGPPAKVESVKFVFPGLKESE